MGSRRTQIRERIMQNVLIQFLGFEIGGVPSPCHTWQGGHSGKGRGGGYARISIDGHTAAVHRVMWTNENGYIPGKKQIDHLCENRLCVNELHLEMVTHKQNQKRKKKR